MLNIGGLSIMSQTVTVSYFSYSLLQKFNNKNTEGKNATTFMLNFVHFKKGGLVYSRVGAGAASKIFFGACAGSAST
jgi:hypothetical protein